MVNIGLFQSNMDEWDDAFKNDGLFFVFWGFFLCFVFVFSRFIHRDIGENTRIYILF